MPALPMVWAEPVLAFAEEPALTALIASLLVTVALLVAVVWSGVTARRSAHYALVVATLAALVWAIREAEAVGRGLVFEGAAATVKNVHFVGVAITFLLLPALSWSGLRLARLEDAGRRALHKKLAWAFLLAVLITCALGTAMTVMAEPAAANDAAPASDN